MWACREELSGHTDSLSLSLSLTHHTSHTLSLALFLWPESRAAGLPGISLTSLSKIERATFAETPLSYRAKWCCRYKTDFNTMMRAHRRAPEVDVRIPGQGNSNSYGARPVHLIITTIKWIRTSSLLIKNSLRQNGIQISLTPVKVQGGLQHAATAFAFRVSRFGFI